MSLHLNQTLLHSFQYPQLLPLLPLLLASTYLISSLSLPISYNLQSLLPDPFQVQLVKSCVLPFGEAPVGFKRIAYEGSDLVSFHNMSWWPSPKGGRRAQQVCNLFNQYHVVNMRIQTLINDLCPRFLLALLDAGKAALQRQGQSCSLPPSFLSALRNLKHLLKLREKRGQEGEG